MTRLRAFRPPTVAALIVVWAVAWSAPMGHVGWDTKYDLLVDPWRLLQRALHLWDAQVAWGGLSNQGYGYLFPMGPFFALGSALAPMWLVQRLWWMVLLTAGFIGALGLLRALGVGTPNARLVGALAWVLAPKVIMSVGVLSAEVQPQVLAPLILWPVVLAARDRVSPWRASALSGLAILACGGVNATATLVALVPTGIFLVSRSRWWRRPLTWLWSAAALMATAWWLGPLVLMSSFAPPFLDWIETARDVSAPITLLDVVRGTTHWLGHLLTPGGAWWPAGYELSTSPGLIILTGMVAALGLAGLTSGSLPLRRFWWLLLVVGVVVLSLPHPGPFSSPFEALSQSTLDGALAPLRNIHKVDLFVRLPVVVGLVHVLGSGRVGEWAATWRRGVALGPSGITALGAVLVVLAAAPAFTGALVARGSHEEVPQHWVELGGWLDEHGEGGAVVVPAASFGEYTWGRTIDEPLRSLTRTPYAVRDAVPLAPAGAIRLLDELEIRLQTGRPLGGTPQVLHRAGVKYLVLRNDLDTGQSGQPPAALARSAIRLTPGVTLAQGFGQTFQDVAGDRVYPLEVYEIQGTDPAPFVIHRRTDLLQANGAADDLISLADAGMGTRTVVFDEDQVGDMADLPRVTTDGTRARDRFFGAPRGEDASATLPPGSVPESRDYRPAAGTQELSTVGYSGIDTVTASSSLGFDFGFAGLAPASRPFAAIDGDPRTAWLTLWDARPSLTIQLNRPQHIESVRITPLTDATRAPGRLDVATDVRVNTDLGSVEAQLADGATDITVVPGKTRHITIEIVRTEQGDPGRALTGLSEVEIPGLSAREVLTIPTTSKPTSVSAMVLNSGLPGRDGCLIDELGLRCLGAESVVPETTGRAIFRLPHMTTGDWVLTGTLRSVFADSGLVGSPDVRVTASSSRTSVPGADPNSIVDADPRTAWSPAVGDREPRLTFRFTEPIRLEQLHFDVRGTWLARARPMVHIQAGTEEVTRRLSADGWVAVPTTMTDEITISFINVPGERTPQLAGMELAEVSFPGADVAGAPAAVSATCGDGPEVTINGRPVPTRVEATRDGWLGISEVHWQACGTAELVGMGDEIMVGPWKGMAPARTFLLRDADVLNTRTGASLVGEWDGSNQATVQLPPAAEDRVLGLTQNASQGWRAKVSDQELTPITLDGHRQGFIIPAGLSGTVQIAFAPEQLYRWLLILGLVLALALPVAALVPTTGRTYDTDHAPGMAIGEGPAGSLLGLLAVGIAAVVAGPAGGAAAVIGTFVARRVTERARALLVAGTVVLVAVGAAVVAPWSPGPVWLEGTIRLLLVAAVVMAAVSGQPGREPGGGQFDEAMAEEPEEQADRQTDS